jgi:uncharacterized protein YdeI (YjbR/CyaY-like superfamily)
MPSSQRKPDADLPVMEFKTPAAWTRWLEKNHVASSGIWMRLAKKATGAPSVTYPDALDIAIAYGWIDGQRRGEGDTTWRIKFTPRSKKSIWSKINRAKALSLTEQGRMKPAGLAEIEKAKKDGRWEAAYDGQRVAAVPRDLQAALNKNPRARAFFATLDSRNRYAILFRLHTAKKEETRAKRLALFVAMLEKHEKLHP